MVIDTSAVLAVLLEEPEAPAFRRALSHDPVRMMSAVSALETTCVLESRRGEQAGVEFELLLHKITVRIMPFDERQLEAARDAWRKFGKGRHPAGLNFGDCVAYALAKVAGERLLFKGNDFTQTDIPAVTV
jgi:ribonuclease VapC